MAPPVDFEMFTDVTTSLIVSAWTLAGLLGLANPKAATKNRTTAITTE